MSCQLQMDVDVATLLAGGGRTNELRELTTERNSRLRSPKTRSVPNNRTAVFSKAQTEQCPISSEIQSRSSDANRHHVLEETR